MWIKTAEQKPEKNTKVLLCSKDGHINTYYWYDEEKDVPYFKESPLDRHAVYISWEHFPYWMPFPELPEELIEKGMSLKVKIDSNIKTNLLQHYYTQYGISN